MTSRIRMTVRLAATALVIGVAAPQLYAQGGNAPAQPPAGGEHHGQWGKQGRFDLFKGITLSDSQKSQIEAIQKRHHDEMKAAMQAARQSGQRPDRAQMQAKMQAQLTELRNVLTADQQKVFDANVKEMQAKREEHRQQMQERMQQSQPQQ